MSSFILTVLLPAKYFSTLKSAQNISIKAREPNNIILKKLKIKVFLPNKWGAAHRQRRLSTFFHEANVSKIKI